MQHTMTKMKNVSYGYIETDNFSGYAFYKFISEDTIEYIRTDGTKWITHYKSLSERINYND